VTTAAPRPPIAGVAAQRELALCVPRRVAFPDGAWHGLVTSGMEQVLVAVATSGRFLPRAQVEDDPDEQQIIPYCIVRHDDGSHLLTRRLRRSSERRLHHLYSLGVGGHVNPGDGSGAAAVAGGVGREWAEEVVCPGRATARLVALLNDDSTPVSRVHLGLVFLVEPEPGARVLVRETDKLEGEALPLEAMRRHYLNMESWSQLAYDDLVGGARERASHSPLVVELAAAP
jgi:predicted NUDIX family phosphoesterase